jgi:hypothetical protein
LRESGGLGDLRLRQALLRQPTDDGVALREGNRRPMTVELQGPSQLFLGGAVFQDHGHHRAAKVRIHLHPMEAIQ